MFDRWEAWDVDGLCRPGAWDHAVTQPPFGALPYTCRPRLMPQVSATLMPTLSPRIWPSWWVGGARVDWKLAIGDVGAIEVRNCRLRATPVSRTCLHARTQQAPCWRSVGRVMTIRAPGESLGKARSGTVWS